MTYRIGGTISAFVCGFVAAVACAGSAVLGFSAAPASHAATTAPAAAATATPVGSAPGPSVATLNDAVERAAAAAGPSVVLIQHRGGLGSGEVVDKRGYIVTNYHVLYGEGIGPTSSTTFTVTLSNGASYTAKVAGTDRADDLAVIKITAPDLRPIGFADSDKARVGQFVLAVGNPLGFSQTVTFGIVSALRRTMSEGGQPAVSIPDMIQTSAPINPGNSGGALVNLDARLLGVPTLAAVDPQQGSAAQGIGFAISSNRVKFIADQIIAHGRVVHSGRPYLGVANLLQVTPYAAAQHNLPVDNGVLIGAVQQGGPAATAGLRPGDIITALAGRATPSLEALTDALAHLRPGQRVPVAVASPQGKRTVTVTLGELPVGP